MEGRGVMLKIYVASFFDDRERLRLEAQKLWAKGHEVVSSWLNEVSRPEHMSKEDFWRKLALKDIAEVKSANLVILDTVNETPRGGREVELGYALAQHQDKSVFLVGPVRNVFHTIVDKRFENWDELLEDLPDAERNKINDNPKVKKPRVIKALAVLKKAKKKKR
jgi:nucleoside 2-deoxyribosyltransferase